MILKLDMKHHGMVLYKMCIKFDCGMTLTYFTTRSTYVAHAFELGTIIKMSFEGKNLQEMSK